MSCAHRLGRLVLADDHTVALLSKVPAECGAETGSPSKRIQDHKNPYQTTILDADDALGVSQFAAIAAGLVCLVAAAAFMLARRG